MIISKKPILAALILSLGISQAAHCFELRPWCWELKTTLAALAASTMVFLCWNEWQKQTASEVLSTSKPKKPNKTEKPIRSPRNTNQHFDGEIDTATAQKVPHGLPVDQRTLGRDVELRNAHLVEQLRQNPNVWNTQPTEDTLLRLAFALKNVKK